MVQKKKFYITTPIYYATAAPHLGTLYSTVLADIAARWHKIQNIPTFFLTGTDEHGQKVAQAAQNAGKEPQKFVDQFIEPYKALWKQYDIEYSHFIRTTDHYHVKAVQKWISDLQKKGDIYKGTYEGWYCTPCETFMTEKDYETGQLNPPCVSCERPTNLVQESCYYFKLSAYQDKLLAFYKENPDFVTPKERLAEVISFVEGGLQDLSISRTTISWGIPFPGDEQHVTYVWADALNNYITGVGYGQEGKEKEFAQWWPADVQVMGKDIVRFHAIYWPAFLMASGLPLPRKLLVHGWIKVGDHKMSKSRGNSVDPKELLDAYGADAVRYYLARQIAITQDGQFTRQDLEQKIGSDLANDLGNLLQRTTTLADKLGFTTLSVDVWNDEEKALYAQSQAVIELFDKEMERGFYHLALAQVWQLLHHANAYFHAASPWKLAGKDDAACQRVLTATCHALHTAGILLWPFMPQKMEQLCERIGRNYQSNQDLVSRIKQPWAGSFIIRKGDALFTKPEPTVVAQQPEVKKEESYIGIEDFIKVDMRSGTITACELVDGSDKLLRLTVDVGECGVRNIFAGVRAFYTPEQLIGKQGVFVVNLKPRKMMGSISEGMMLTAEKEDGTITMLTPAVDARNGGRVK